MRDFSRLAVHSQPRLAADLLERVHRNEISANNAAIQLGLRNRVVNFDLNKLTSEVRTEINSLKEQEDWTTAEVIEEALRAYFRVLNADEPQDLIEPTEQVIVKRIAPAINKGRSKRIPPEGRLTGTAVAEIINKPANQMGPLVARAHQRGQSAEVSTPDNSRMFIREPDQKFWKEIL